ncbi:MAG: M10 family metallopeptidase C-terminal domain-containing protein [Amaricoccus sp.]|uniref:calcium-binding protein n=1 Tax=Amaricoccus sp. TaxID=1872485 RepID=UPI0039E68791
MTTYLWLFDAAGPTDQWPAYTPTDVRLVTATRTLLDYSGTISDGVFAGDSLRETYHGRFNLSGSAPAGRIGSVDVAFDDTPVFGARFDDPVRVRAYPADFTERMTGDVSFRGNASANAMETGAGNDSLTGGAGNDTLSSGAGHDRLFGGAGQDVLVGGAGRDTMVGGDGNDVYVVFGPDRLVEAADGGRDSIGAVVDYRLPLNFEALVLYGSAVSGWGNGTRNWLAGNEQANVLDGLAGGDVLAGFAGADTLVGGFGDNSLLGGFGRDRLIGGAGDDNLLGGAHGDWLTGGAGDDVFGFVKASDSAPSLRDVISDFGTGDTIDLSEIDARSDHAGEDAFRYIGARTFDGTSGEVRYAHGLLSGDVDGDGAADFVIRVLGAPALHADDLVL